MTDYEFDKVPFREYGEGSQDKAVVIPTKWNEDEVEWLSDGMVRLRQTKKGTAIKQLAQIGYAKVVSEQKMLEIGLKNHRKNERLGLGDIENTIKKTFKKSQK